MIYKLVEGVYRADLVSSKFPMKESLGFDTPIISKNSARLLSSSTALGVIGRLRLRVQQTSMNSNILIPLLLYLWRKKRDW